MNFNQELTLNQIKKIAAGAKKTHLIKLFHHFSHKFFVAGKIQKNQAIGAKISKNQITRTLINKRKAKAAKTKAAIIVKIIERNKAAITFQKRSPLILPQSTLGAVIS